jgi:uncharacterized protein
MIHPHSEVRFISKEIGYGVVATKFIPKGTITWAYDQLDRSFTPAAYHAMNELYKNILTTYCYRDQIGNYVLCWDNARFVNHSFHSNCISTAYNFEIAVRDIHPGEQLTDDYGYLNCIEPFECLPEPGTNRTSVMPDDLLHCYEEWDSLLLNAFPYFDKVDQPLAALLDDTILQKANNVANGIEPMDSILNCFYNEDKCLMQKKEALLRELRVYQLQNV